jgi:hypothetical protein
MKNLATINNYESFFFKANIVPRDPESGFSLAFGNTGGSLDFVTGVVFSGARGMVYDQFGNFFGGYYSGRSLDIEGHFFGDRLSYFYNGVLIKNNFPISNNFDAIEFDKHGESQLSLNVSYVSGARGPNYLLGSDSSIVLGSDESPVLGS